MEFEEHINYSMLFDIYGKLLSSKQYEIMEAFLNLDIGESELAESLNSSRQSVHDAVVKAKKQLDEFENKCGILKEKLERNKNLKMAKSFLKSDDINTQKVLEYLNKIE